MDRRLKQESAFGMRNRNCRWASIVLVAVAAAACNQQTSTKAPSPQTAPASQTAAAQDGKTVLNPPGGHPLVDNPDPDEYGEFLAKPEELASVPTNEIAKSIRLNATATAVGRVVYAKNCAACHGADLKGKPEAHAPDLTDDDWRFSGDDLPSGGVNK